MRNHWKYIYWGCVLVFCLIFSPSFAQKKGEKIKPPQYTPEEQSLITTFKEYTSAYQHINYTKDVNTVLKYVDMSLSSRIITYDVRDNFLAIDSDYAGFLDHLKKITKNNELLVTYSTSDILKVVVSGNVGVIITSAEFQYNSQKDGSLYHKGREPSMFIFRRKGNDWKLIHLTVVTIEDEKSKGACFCEIYKASANTSSYVAKTQIPSGKSYANQLNNFDFIKTTTGERTITVEHNLYIWKPNGDIYFVKEAEGGKTEEKVAEAHPQDEVDAIVKVLKTHLYANNCLSLKVK